MATQIDCIGVGSPLVDILARVEDGFIGKTGGGKGGMVLVDSRQMGQMLADIEGDLHEAPGGSASNTAVALARLGDRVSFLGKIGDDATGEFFKASFAKMGGDTQRLKIAPVANGRCLSLITPDGERTMRTDLGAAMTLSPDEVSAGDFSGCRHAHIEGYLLFNRDLMRKVVDSAKAAGCTLSIDLASFEVVEASKDILPDLLKQDVTVAFANEDEARALFGGNDFEQMARQLGELCEVGVVKLGARGALICSRGKVVRVPPVRVADVVDATGAGDYWAAGFLHGWFAGMPLELCGRYGSVLGAQIVQILGAELPEDGWETVHRHLEAVEEDFRVG